MVRHPKEGAAWAQNKHGLSTALRHAVYSGLVVLTFEALHLSITSSASHLPFRNCRDVLTTVCSGKAMSTHPAGRSGDLTLQIPMNTLSPAAGPRLSSASLPFPTPLNGGTPAYVGEPEDPAGIDLTGQPESLKPDTVETWKHVLATMKKYDEKMVANWKDELSNLLIFVRLVRILTT